MPTRKRKASRPASSSHDQSEREDSSSSTELNSDIPYDVLKEKGAAKRLKRCSETFPKQMRKIEKVMEGLFNYADKLEGRMNERMRTQEERMQLEMRAIRKEMEALTRKVQECERGWQGNLYNIILLTLHPQLQIAP